MLERLTQVVREAEKQTDARLGRHVERADRGLESQSPRRPGDRQGADRHARRYAAQGKPLAVLVNFTAHPTFMSGEDMLFSGDWPGHLQRTSSR